MERKSVHLKRGGLTEVPLDSIVAPESKIMIENFINEALEK